VETQPFPGGPKVRGDTKLQASYVDNVDLRWEWFLNPGEVLAVSGFYKNIFRPIEITYDLQGNNTMKWNNVPEAYVFGTELEARASLGHFHEALGNFTVGGNLTLASSGVDLDSATLASRRYVDPKAKDTRPLQGQSPYVINFQFSYSNEDVGTNVGVFFNIFGKRMSSSGKNVTPDIYEMPYPSLNVTFSQQVGKRVKIKTTVKDILDAPNEKAHLFKGDRFVSSRNYRGLSASLSASIDAF
jgi:outer membrane receptor for ferrienterochelin and colicin